MARLQYAGLMLIAMAAVVALAGCDGGSSEPETPLPTSTATPPTPAYYSEKACSLILDAVLSHENGDIELSEAISRMSEGGAFLDKAEPSVRDAGVALLEVIGTPPYRGGGALLPFDELYPEGVTFRGVCEDHGHW